MRYAFCIALMLALSIAAFPQQTIRADTNPEADAEIKSLELKMAQWIVHGDWDEYARHLASEYLHTGYSGQVESKEEAMTALRDERRRIIVMEVEPSDQRVRIYGDTAISNAEFTISVRESGQLKTRRLRMTHVFIRREGQLYLVAEQATSLGK